MKKYFVLLISTAFGCAVSLPAQDSKNLGSTSPARGGELAATNNADDYAADIGVVIDAEQKALEQARELLNGGGATADKTALQAAIREMEVSRAALEAARKSPDKLPAAIAAEEAAYQALLKAIPREYRMSRSRSRSQNGSRSGQPGQEQMDQLDTSTQDNRYETERQATATPTPQQREQSQTVDRLKQLARRQQDLNDRLRDLQTALQEARTDVEREDIQHQLKRLRDEERQMLSDVDELRQQLEQSPDAAKQAQARQQLEQTHTDVQRAAQELERKSVSEALAAGARAEQNLQNVRENMRQQNSSQFAEQMRQLRSESRDLAKQENEISTHLAGLNDSGRKTLDDSAQRQALADQMTRQQSALTNILAQMRAVTEQSESTEPLLSKQLYDVVRRADQSHTDNQLEIGAQLTTRGFLPQAAQAEHSASQNIDELHQGIEHAAESVLGSEADALRYAQKELDDLASQVARSVAGKTNSALSADGGDSRAVGKTNSQARAGGRMANQNGNGNGRADTNQIAGNPSGVGGAESPPGGEQNSQTGPQNTPREEGKSGGKNAATSSQAGQSGNSAAGKNAQDGGEQAGANGGNDTSSKERLTQFAQQLGGGRGGWGGNGPITGNNYLDWTDRLRDVEQALDSPDLRNQLATVRERVGVYRRAFRENGRIPSNEELQNQVIKPLALARGWVAEELSRTQNDRSLVPLDRDRVQEKYSELVRKYYEKLGSPQ